MSDKYRKSMDRISVSDELNARILTEADKKINSKKTRRLPVFYIRCAAACAMCAALCITVFNIADRRSQMGIVPTQTLSPQTTAAPKPTPQNTQPADTAPENSYKISSVPQIKTAQPTPETTFSPLPASGENDSKAEKPESTPNPPESVSPSAPSAGEEGETLENSGPVALPPSAEIENDVDKIRDEVGYEFKVPSYLPEGYELSEASLLFGTLIQLRYESDENSILFRTEKTAEDISGDYSIYETVEKESIKGNDVTLRANGEIYYSAVWISDDAYSLYAPCGLAKEELVKIIENIK